MGKSEYSEQTVVLWCTIQRTHLGWNPDLRVDELKAIRLNCNLVLFSNLHVQLTAYKYYNSALFSCIETLPYAPPCIRFYFPLFRAKLAARER
jgi:hypothetical protein